MNILLFAGGKISTFIGFGGGNEEKRKRGEGEKGKRKGKGGREKGKGGRGKGKRQDGREKGNEEMNYLFTETKTVSKKLSK